MSPPAYSRSGTIESAKTQTFDLLIIGGGITAAGIARDASQRGLKTLLVEKGDFASGTSSKSSKLVHGGLRYLAHGHLKLVSESCRERYRLMTTVAPHLVKPINFLLPLYPGRQHPWWLVLFGMFLYDCLAMFRNYRRFHYLTRAHLRALLPSLRTDDCLGAASYYDCKVLDFRLTLDTLKSAHEQGAQLLNYCKVNEICLRSPAQTHRIRLQDVLDPSSELEAKAKVIVNAAGAWADDILRMSGSTDLFNLKATSGIHLIVDIPNTHIKQAVAFESCIDQRNIFAIPWGGRILLGTTDQFCSELDQIPIPPEAIDYLLTSFNNLFPHSPITRKNILTTYVGVRPLIGSDLNLKESDLPRDFMIKIEQSGLVSITGGKLTTYRSMAQLVVDKIIKHFFPHTELKPCQTLSPISGASELLPDTNELELLQNSRLSGDSFSHLIDAYGSNYKTILSYTLTHRETTQRISAHLPYIFAEVDYFVEHEFAQRLEDILLRRTPIFLFSDDNGLDASSSIAKYMAKKLGWSELVTQREIAHYMDLIQHMKHALEQPPVG